MTNYEKIAELAVNTARVIKHDAHRLICHAHWCAFQLLYTEMVKRGEITPIRDLGKDKLLLYWTEACLGEPGARKYKKIWLTQALYMYDLIAQKDENKIRE